MNEIENYVLPAAQTDSTAGNEIRHRFCWRFFFVFKRDAREDRHGRSTIRLVHIKVEFSQRQINRKTFFERVPLKTNRCL